MRYVPQIGLLISSCALLIAWLNFSKTRELQCNTESSCLSSNFRITELDSNLQAAYKGKVIDDICFTRLYFNCTGAIPIEAEDYNDQPIVVNLNGDCQLIEAQIENDTSNPVRPILQSSSSTIEIDPILLNPGDNFSIYLVTTGSEPNITIGARITGVTEIGSSSKSKRAPRLDYAKWLLLFITCSLTTIIFSFTVKGVYHGKPKKESVIFVPKRPYTIWLFVLFMLALAGVLVTAYIMNSGWILPIFIAINIGMLVTMFTVMFRGSRWAVYKEVANEAERRKLGDVYL